MKDFFESYWLSLYEENLLVTFVMKDFFESYWLSYEENLLVTFWGAPIAQL